MHYYHTSICDDHHGIILTEYIFLSSFSSFILIFSWWQRIWNCCVCIIVVVINFDLKNDNICMNEEPSINKKNLSRCHSTIVAAITLLSSESKLCSLFDRKWVNVWRQSAIQCIFPMSYSCVKWSSGWKTCGCYQSIYVLQQQNYSRLQIT